MPRPPKWRRVAFLPQVTHFKPAGIPLRILDEVQLSVEEAEAIRLKDLECLEQEKGAERMNISPVARAVPLAVTILSLFLFRKRFDL